MISSPIWLPATLVAGLFQAWRTAVQRRVGQTMSVNAAGLVRYLYGLPVVVALLATYQLGIAPAPFPSVSRWLLPLCIASGIGQILATNALLMAFGHRNFLVGTAYAKTEAVQGALLSLVLLNERLPLLGWIGILFGVAGVMTLSTGGKPMRPLDFVRALGQPAARYGITAGFLFAITAVGVRWATREVDTPDPVRAALIVLVLTVLLQTLMQGGYLVWRERDQVPRVFASWRVSGQVGLLSALGSACWFTGYATAPIALVRIVGQVEVAFTLLFSRFYLGEKMLRSEAAGLLLVVTGVVLALAGAL